jgi:signal transduction histidine kinase
MKKKDPDLIVKEDSNNLNESYSRINRYFTVIVFITSIVGASADTIIYSHQFRFIFVINLVLIALLLLLLLLLLTKKLEIITVFTILLYATLLNITLSHVHEIRYDNYLAKSIMIGVWGILFVALSGMVPGKRHPYIVMLWAVSLLVFDIFRTNDDFLKGTIPMVIITLVGFSYGVSKYMKLFKDAFQKNQEALAEISRQKSFIEKQAGELEVTNINLKELQNVQKDLIEMIVHDMKNPLNSILNNSSKSPSKTANKYIHEAGRQMLLLVENMLDVYRMENTETKLEVEVLNLSETLQGAMSQVEYLVYQHNINMEINVDENLFVLADREILIRIFVNLFTNAIKHSPESSVIKVNSTRNDRHEVVLSIADQGEGIPESYKDRVFEKFVQIIIRKSGSARSTGLGLTFCKMSIELMNGNIWIADSSSRGTTVSFSLPAAQARRSGEPRKPVAAIEFHFTADEKQLLLPIVQKLVKLDMYKAGLIIQELGKLPLNNPDVEEWVEQVKDAVYSVNPKRFKQLLDMVKED